MHRAALALLASSHLAVCAIGQLDLVLLPAGQYEGGKCIDGTPAGYYYGPPSSGSSTLWVLWLDGGGGCQTKVQCAMWASINGGQRGGSTNWGARKTVVGGILSSDAASNPDFHDAHHVRVPYCTGDSFTGQVSTPTEADHWGYYFDGHLNVKAIAHHIYTTIPAAPQMQRVLFTGLSAGGRGVFFNCDFLQDYLKQLGATSVSVMCNPRSGWFMPGNVQEGAHPESPPTPWEYWSTGSLPPVGARSSPYDEYLHPACVAAAGADVVKCTTVHSLYQHIEAPIYAIQDTFDTNIVFQRSQLPRQAASSPEGREFVAYIGNCTKASMRQIVVHPKGKLGDGMFLTSCFNHGSFASIGGIKKDEGVGDWFFGRNPGRVVSMDTCDSAPPYLPCNPECAGIEEDGTCLAFLQAQCGRATSENRCVLCAKRSEDDMAGAGCTTDMVETLCAAGLHQASTDGTDQASADGTDQVPADGADQAPADGIDQGSAEGTDRGSADGTDQGSANGTDQGSADGTDQEPADRIDQKTANGTPQLQYAALTVLAPALWAVHS